MLTAEDKRCIRAVVRKIHPDKFMQHPEEQLLNSESLKTLNAFLEGYVQGQTVRSSVLSFWTVAEGGTNKGTSAAAGEREGEGDEAKAKAKGDQQSEELVKVKVELSGRQSLFDVFDAFGVEHAQRDDALARNLGEKMSDMDFLVYMQGKISEALAISERFSALSSTAAQLKEDLSERYAFEELRFQDVVRTSCANAVWQVSALEVLSQAMESLDPESQRTFANQRVVLHRERRRSFSAVQGREIHLVVNRTLKSQLRKIDGHLLGTLSKLNTYWRQRIRVLVPAVQSVLRVKAVLGDFVYNGDGHSTSSPEDAVLWAGKIIKAREAFDLAFDGPQGGRESESEGVRGSEGESRFHFSILVHSDESMPFIDVSPTSTMVQVRSDCPPGALVAFLCSDEARELNERVRVIESQRSLESDHLARVKKALKAKQVIRVCSMPDMAPFYGACERLVANAEYIASQVELKGIFLAIDDCYEVWESGFVSVPYDFEIEVLCQTLGALKAAEKKAGPNLLSIEGSPSPSSPTSRVTRREESPQSRQAVQRQSSFSLAPHRSRARPQRQVGRSNLALLRSARSRTSGLQRLRL